MALPDDADDGPVPPGPSRWFFWFCRIVWPLQSLFARVRTPPPPPGLHDGGPKILIANHRSLFDVMVGVTLCRRWRFPAAFLVNARYFDSRMLRIPLRMVGAVPVDQDKPRAALRDSMALLESGTSVLIMPEGRVAPRGTPPRSLIDVSAGAALLASRTGADVLVGGIHGADVVWPADLLRPVTRPWRRGRVTLTATRLPVTVGESRRALNARIVAAMEHQLDLAVTIATGDPAPSPVLAPAPDPAREPSVAQAGVGIGAGAEAETLRS